MRRELKVGAGLTALLMTAATVAMTVGSVPGHAEGTASSAYGLAAEGPIPIDPTPFVESTDGSLQTSSLVELPENPVVTLAAATVTAEGDTASVQLADVAVGGGLLAEIPPPPQELVDACEQLEAGLTDNIDPNLLDPLLDPLGGAGLPVEDLPVEDLTQLCETLLTPPSSLLGVEVLEVFCDGAAGGIRIAGVDLLGQAIEVPGTEPNTEIPADPLLNVTLNRQTSNADGSFTVEGLVVGLLDGTEILTVGSATCGNPRRTPPPAPAPVPVETRAPVTG